MTHDNTCLKVGVTAPRIGAALVCVVFCFTPAAAAQQGWIIPSTNEETGRQAIPVNDVGWIIPTTNEDPFAGDDEARGESVGWPFPTTNEDDRKHRQKPDGVDVKVHQILHDPDGGYLIATFRDSLLLAGSVFRGVGGQDLFVARFDATGDWVWGAVLGGAGHDSDPAVALGEAGDLFLAASFSKRIRLGGNTLVSMGYRDLFVVRLDCKGVPFWSRQLGGVGEDHLDHIRLSQNGGLLVAGSISHRESFDAASGFGQVTVKSFAAEYTQSGELLGVRLD